MPETKKVSCVFCSLQCGFGLEVEEGVPVRIDLDPGSRQNKGALCARGHYNLEIAESPKRFLGATVARRRVPLGTAVTRAASALAGQKASSGGAVGLILGADLSNEDYDAAVEFGRTVLGTRNIAVAYDGGDLPLLAGGGPGDAAPEDMDDAEAFVLVGDVFWGHPCVSKRIISARHVSRSHRIYTANPFRTNTDWFSDRQAVVRPNAEPVFLAALLSAMNAPGAPRVDVAKAAAACRMTPQEIEGIAKDLAGRKKTLVAVSGRLGDSVSAYLTGLLAAKLAKACHGTYVPLFRGGNAIGAYARVGTGRTLPEVLAGVEAGEVAALMVLGPDILQLYPRALSPDALEKLPFLAASAIFENDTAKRADVVFPHAAWTEAAGSYSASFGLSTTISPALAPQGDGAPVRDILAMLAEELGSPLTGAKARGEHPPVEIDVDAALAALLVRTGDGTEFIENISPVHSGDGSVTGRMAFPRQLTPYCEIWIGQGTASRAGIGSGETATIASERGETTIPATVTDRMPEGLVAVPTYVPDARGLMGWAPNPKTRWFDVTTRGASVRRG